MAVKLTHRLAADLIYDPSLGNERREAGTLLHSTPSDQSFGKNKKKKVDTTGRQVISRPGLHLHLHPPSSSTAKQSKGRPCLVRKILVFWLL